MDREVTDVDMEDNPETLQEEDEGEDRLTVRPLEKSCFILYYDCPDMVIPILNKPILLS